MDYKTYKAAMEACLDQLDALLRDHSDILHEVAMKSSAEWDDEDWRIVTLSLHTTAARAAYLKGEVTNEEEFDT